ncbi:gamma-glutamyltransferase [Bosea sp. (in: a-proteobacteria)]|uniref:gamma-glutamyltransferase family protein n=1 Tax=Bosea sp. (in: a-proteobacteria) TaxID=1871050 RepID=UPI0011F81EC1|nr:gamma-glutamyltransferase [Bosea sp. (in: a-proteobacteria)]TAJ29626.1 MAG: gamma-glutamyltranspeptidase [Bosea sp. (in: a-proteobacteria)]
MHGRRPTMTSRHGMVAAAHPLAAQAGARLLAQGGNAFDAAAATAAALNVVEPFMSGLAGMGFATCWVAAEARVRVLDFVPPIPASFPAERFRQRSDLNRGPLSVASPGNLAGWCELVKAYGRKSLRDIFAPAIALARDGFALAEFGADEFAEHGPAVQAMPALAPAWTANYAAPGAIPGLGDVLVQADLARTLTDIAESGPDHFYRGALGERVTAHLQALGGTLTMADLDAVKAVWREPLALGYRDLQVHVPPPPCEGFQFLLTLAILDGVDLGAHPKDGPEHLDLVYRAIRLAAGERIAHNNPAPDQLAQMLSTPSIERLRARLLDGKPVTGPTEQWTPLEGEDPAHTTSFSIADGEGNLICITQSLGSPFGSGVVVPGTGLCLNNFLYWADVQTGSPNRAKPGDALAMCMSPSISTRDGRPVLALGTPGSYGIMQTQAQAMVQHLVFGLPLQEAIEAPRARLWDGSLVEIENRIAPETIAALRHRGHDARAFDVGWTMRCGGMQAVAVDPATGVLTGAADPRRDGYVATP